MGHGSPARPVEARVMWAMVPQQGLLRPCHVGHGSPARPVEARVMWAMVPQQGLLRPASCGPWFRSKAC